MSLKRINNFIVHIISYWTKSSCEKIFPSWKISRKFEIRWYIAKKQIDIEFLFKVWFSGICMKFHRFTSKKSGFREKFWLNIFTWLWFSFLWFGKLVNLNSLNCQRWFNTVSSSKMGAKRPFFGCVKKLEINVSGRISKKN